MKKDDNNKSRIEVLKDRIKTFQNTTEKEKPMEKIIRLREEYRNAAKIKNNEDPINRIKNNRFN